jgi:hypothetical protein
MFFLGSSKLFGAWVFTCALTIWLGASVTNYLTKSLCRLPDISSLLDSREQTAGIIASLFWKDGNATFQAAAYLAKWISLLNIASVLWLDFALFADISGSLVGYNSLLVKLTILSIATFVICHFTLKYGLRGFVFADLFQAPVVVFGSVILLGGCAYLWAHGFHTMNPTDFFRPALPRYECLLFAAHVLFLNGLFVVLTEPHWLRVWIFREKETQMQIRAVGATAISWLVLMLIGLFASSITSQVGEGAVIGLLNQLGVLSPIFFVAFWVAGVAALFSSADSQIYSMLVVREFDTGTGRLKTRLMSSLRPTRTAAYIALTFVVVYAIVRALGLPFEKIIFVITPLSLNLLPAFVLRASGLVPRPTYVWISLAGYTVCSLVGFLRPETTFAWTLSAALIPIVMSILAFLFENLARRSDDHAIPS